MKKYHVTIYYHTSITVDVEAWNEEEAIASAHLEAGKSEYDSEFIFNAQEDGYPDVEIAVEDE